MIELLANTIARIGRVVVSVRALHFLPVTQYRSSAMRLMRLLSDEEIRDEVADLRRFVWMRVAQVLRTPCEWSATWQSESTRMLVDFQASNRWGPSIASAADEFVRMTKQLHDIGSNPFRQTFVSVLDSISADEKVAVVLPPQRDLASEFECLAHPNLPSERLLSESRLRRRTDSFDYLIMLGRFDDRTPHHIFSAPNWTRILNLRWSGDNDDEEVLPLLPVFSTGAAVPAERAMANDIQTCPWLVWENRNEVVQYTQVREPMGVAGDSLPWSAPDFDDLFRPTRRDRCPTLAPLYSGYAVWVALSSGGGSYVGLDEEGRSRPVWVLDEEDGTRVMHCIPNSSDPPDQRPLLEEGCIVVVPLAPQRTVRVRATVDLARRQREWKAKLASRMAKYSAVHVANELRGYGLSLSALESAVSRWSNDNAPQEERVFKILVRDYLGMRHPDPDEESARPWWQSAWDDIVELRRANQAAGQHRRWQQDAMSDEVVKREYMRIVDEVDRLGISCVQVDEDYTLACGRMQHICRGVDGRGYRLPVDECGYYVGPESAPDACGE